MHGAAELFRRALEICAAKSVTFEEKNSVRIKNSLKKVLKIKKSFQLLLSEAEAGAPVSAVGVGGLPRLRWPMGL